MLLVLLGCTAGPKDTSPDDTAPDDTAPDDSAGTPSCPVALVTPDELSWEDLAFGQPAVAAVSVVNNCVGEGALSVVAEVSGADFAVVGSPASLDPGGVVTLEVTVTPSAYEALTGTLVLTLNDPALPTVAIPLAATVDADADDDGHDARAAGGDDCDDTDAAVYPGAADAWYDGVDSDCDGASDFDQDGDGSDRDDGSGGDCDDADPSVYPGAPDAWYDGVDSNCDGASDYDQDGDGIDLGEGPEDDCDDEDATAYPGGTETWYDGVDGDCNGASDFDQDGDGVDLGTDPGEDCDDEDAAVYPGAADAWYDGVDSNCDGASDDDQDGDGADRGTGPGEDCDDEDPAVGPSALETWYDGVDSDCDGASDYDQDGDGVDAGAGPDDDCDDEDATVYPDASDAWYDGVDANCDGASDYDQDGDGVDRHPEGGDCADLDAATLDGTEEVLNGLDDDCDGQVDEGLVTAGAVVVSEVLADPYYTADTSGEWFEVYNTTATDLDLNGWVVYSDDGGSFTITGSLPLPAHGYAVLGVESNEDRNGGVTVDYEYPRSSFTLGDDGDSIYLQAGDTPISEVIWTSTWPAALYTGVAQALDPDHLDATDALSYGYWCAATQALTSGDLGTPGEANANCRGLDDDDDGHASNDCDDDDATIYPGAEEVLGDGVDQGCDTFADNETYAEGSLPYVRGGTREGALTTLGLGDTDGDGGLDVVTATETGNVYLFDGAGYSSWAGTASTLAAASFRMSASSPAPSKSWGVGDYTGDGIADVTLLTASGLTGWAGPFSGTGGTRMPDLAINNFSIIGSLGPHVLAGGDYDGDGTDDLLWADPQSTRSVGSDGYLALYAGGALSGTLRLADADTILSGGAPGAQLGALVEVGDVDGDGRDDLVVATADTPAQPTYVWTSDGFATAEAELPDVASTIVETPGTDSVEGYVWMALHDLDADGQVDLAYTSYTSAGTQAGFYLGLPGGGATVSSPDLTWTKGVRFVDATYDTDGDGHAEQALIVDPGDGAPHFLGFLAATALDDLAIGPDDASWGVGVPDPVATDFHLGDLDSDGDVELIAWDPDATVSTTGEGALQVVPGP